MALKDSSVVVIELHQSNVVLVHLHIMPLQRPPRESPGAEFYIANVLVTCKEGTENIVPGCSPDE